MAASPPRTAPTRAPAPVIRALVLAAGGATRFGAPKQLATLAGRPLLEHVLELARPHWPVVVLGAHAEAISAAIDLTGCEVVHCAAWAQGQSTSLRAGLAALGEVDGALVLLGDQPLLTPAVLDGTLARLDQAVDAVRPIYDGAPGHPVLLTRSGLRRAAAAAGDAGARTVLHGALVHTWDATGLADPRDVDTPADLHALAAPPAASR